MLEWQSVLPDFTFVVGWKLGHFFWFCSQTAKGTILGFEKLVHAAVSRSLDKENKDHLPELTYMGPTTAAYVHHCLFRASSLLIKFSLKCLYGLIEVTPAFTTGVKDFSLTWMNSHVWSSIINSHTIWIQYALLEILLQVLTKPLDTIKSKKRLYWKHLAALKRLHMSQHRTTIKRYEHSTKECA